MDAVRHDRSVREFSALRPRLRSDLHVTVQKARGRVCCLIADPLNGSFHRVGAAEWQLIRALDGSRSIAAILAEFARNPAGGESVNEAEAEQILRWLRERQLLVTEAGFEPVASARRSSVAWLNPLMIRVPLGRPDRFFARWSGRARWVLGKGGFVIWLLVVGYTSLELAVQGERLTSGFAHVVSRENWWLIGFAWIGLKTVHELGHGLFCRHFGAQVREIGVVLVLFMPIGYVDVTPCLGLHSKWERFAIAAAGLYFEAFVAALAGLAWVYSDPGVLQSLAFNVLTIGTVVTWFFNANPLMRFDGHYLFSEALELPNLYSRSRRWLAHQLRWLLIGDWREPKPPIAEPDGWWIGIYSVASTLFQCSAIAGLLIAASAFFKGGGLWMAIIAAMSWVLAPLSRFFEGLVRGADSVAWARLGMRMGFLAAIVGAALFTPWPSEIRAVGVTQWADPAVLRAGCPGFVAQVIAEDGSRVDEGQLLVRLQNPSLEADVARLRWQLNAQESQARLALSQADTAGYQAQQARVEATRRTLREQTDLLKACEIRAPFPGVVHGRCLSNFLGRFLKPGEEILTLGREGQPELRLAVSQSDAPHFKSAFHEAAEVRIPGRGLVGQAKLLRIDSKATSDIPHPALAGTFGGPLPVRQSAEPHKTGQLLEPCFVAVAQLRGSVDVGSGEIAYVKLANAPNEALWRRVQRAFECWVSKRLGTSGSSG